MAETTPLSPVDEIAFRIWAKQNGIHDVDHPDSHYDYRGFWKATQGAAHGAPGSGEHFPDTFKQHGHPTFSQESQYSAGPFDGGRWVGEQFVPPGADQLMTSRMTEPNPLLAQALQALLKGGH